MLEREKQVENCTFVKTVLLVMMVLYHSMVFWTKNWFDAYEVVFESSWIGVFSKWFNSFRVYAFALVSGYLFYYLKWELGKYKKYSTFILTKVKRLLVPSVFTTLFWVLPITQLFYRYSWTDLVKKYFLAISPSQLWFLWMLFWVFLITWPLSNFFKKINSLIVVLIIWGIGVVGARFLPNVFCIWTGLMYLPYFWVGFKLCQYAERIKLSWGLLSIAQIALYLFQYIYPIPGKINVIYNLVLHSIGGVAIFALLQKLATKVNWKESKVFGFLSKRSMPIYLFHQQLVYFSIALFNGKVIPEINVVLNFGIALCGSIIISTVLMRFKTTRFLIGEKA